MKNALVFSQSEVRVFFPSTLLQYYMKENDNAPNQCGVPSPISVNCPGQHTTTMCNSVINTTFPKRIDIALQLIMSIQENILEKYKSNSDVTQREDT